MALIGPDGERGSIEHEFNKYNHSVGSDHHGASYKMEQKFQDREETGFMNNGRGSRSLAQTYRPGLLGRLKIAVFGESEAEYVDLGEEVDGEHGVIDPREHNVPVVQDWMDEQLAQGNLGEVDRLLAKEEASQERKGILDYVTGDDLQRLGEEELGEAEFYDSKADIDSVEHI